MPEASRVYPKLRGRQQITVRYRETADQLAFWNDLKQHPAANVSPFIQHRIDIESARAEGALDALMFALHDVV